MYGTVCYLCLWKAIKKSFSPLFAAFAKVGGYENLVSGYFEATASVQAFKVPGDNSSGLCGAVPQDAMHLFRSNVPGESDLPWTGVCNFRNFQNFKMQFITRVV